MDDWLRESVSLPVFHITSAGSLLQARSSAIYCQLGPLQGEGLPGMLELSVPTPAVGSTLTTGVALPSPRKRKCLEGGVRRFPEGQAGNKFLINAKRDRN